MSELERLRVRPRSCLRRPSTLARPTNQPGDGTDPSSLTRHVITNSLVSVHTVRILLSAMSSSPPRPSSPVQPPSDASTSSLSRHSQPAHDKTAHIRPTEGRPLPPLPVELVKLIFEGCDPPTLASICLASHGSAALAAPHLYRDVSINLVESLRKLLRIDVVSVLALCWFLPAPSTGASALCGQDAHLGPRHPARRSEQLGSRPHLWESCSPSPRSKR